MFFFLLGGGGKYSSNPSGFINHLFFLLYIYFFFLSSNICQGEFSNTSNISSPLTNGSLQLYLLNIHVYLCQTDPRSWVMFRCSLRCSIDFVARGFLMKGMARFQAFFFEPVLSFSLFSFSGPVRKEINVNILWSKWTRDSMCVCVMYISFFFPYIYLLLFMSLSVSPPPPLFGI